MANKRLPLSFPELEGRGRRAILRTSEEVQAEQDLLETQQAGNPASGHNDASADEESESAPGGASMDISADAGPVPASQQSRILETQQAGIPTSQPEGSKAGYIKATYRLSPDAIDAIEDAKRILRRQYGLRTGLEEIAEQAIIAAYRDLLENQQSSMLARQLSSKTANKKASKPGNG